MNGDRLTPGLSPDTQAVLLLCGRFGGRAAGVEPLAPGEYGRLVKWLRARQLRPSDLLDAGAPSLLSSLVEAKLDPVRIRALLQRGAALALATEKWLRSGLWIISRGDESYPRRLKRKLGEDAPALLYGVGDADLLDLGGLAIVGSRDASEDILDFTRGVAAQCAKEGLGVISGGARGVDAAAMQGASEAGGKVIGVLADSLLRAFVNRENRLGIEDRRLVLISPFNPEAGFNAGNAMQRNRYIYTLADFALVAQTSLEKGGTWTGAVENLKAGWVPLFARDDPSSAGIAALVKQGARCFEFDPAGHGTLWEYLQGAVPKQVDATPKGTELFDTTGPGATAPAVREREAVFEVSQTEPETNFLGDLQKRRLSFDKPVPFTPVGLYLGQGAMGLEVLLLESGCKPAVADLRAAWKLRQAGRAVPILLVVLSPQGVSICGPGAEEPPIVEGIDSGQAERLCREALALPDRHVARRFLAQALPSLETRLPGIRNEGLLANHELAVGVRQRHDWEQARIRASRALGQAGETFLRTLGFDVERCDGLTSFLKARDRKTALAVLLYQTESPETGTARFSGLSPITYALSVADRENLPYVVVVQESRIRLYPTDVGKGVGRRARTETYIECHTSLLRDQDSAYLWLLFSSDALARGGTFEQILDESGRFAGDLAERLRDRIYERVVPALATAIADARALKKPTADQLALTYEIALTVLFRLLFIAYAEDRDLLPYKFNDAYRRRSLKQKALELKEVVVPASGDTHWREIQALFEAVDGGNPEWAVPAYNGGLFSHDPQISRAGAEIARVKLPDAAFLFVLRDLLLIETEGEEIGPVDFRSLGVREFGTIYEGLLESELSVAETDLALDTKGHYVPVKRKGQKAVVEAGEIYLHNRSGARKSMGSYFTKSFAVEHLLERALEPALTAHLARLDTQSETDAANAFFDFRVADIAMGSAHFLVAAIDRIERRLSSHLAARVLPGVQVELARLRGAAEKALGPLAEQIVIEDGQLLRRLIARRCVYGVDISPLSVQLARLGVWIHTFVPGLPLSFLDHNFVIGNSLIGVGSVRELRAKFDEVSGGLFPIDTDALLGAAARPLQRLAGLTDATRADIEAARAATGEARAAIAPTEALCDVIAAQQIEGPDEIQFQFSEWESLKDKLSGSAVHRKAHRVLDGLGTMHFPVTFPEVFLRGRAGFDIVVGNPPWQEVTVEEHAFWARHFPGLRSLSQRDAETEKQKHRTERPDLVIQYEAELDEAERFRTALTSGAYPGMGTGDPDVYKAFIWRFWNLIVEDGGWIGVVLPRSALSAKGSTEFRYRVFQNSEPLNITMLLNRGGWVFEDAEHRYTIGLVALRRHEPEGKSIRLSGPYASMDRYIAGISKPPAEFAPKEVLSWTDTASLPLLPTDESIEVFAQMRKAPRLDLDDGRSWRARPDAELHATAQKGLMDMDSEKRPKGFWPIYKGESFDLWTPDTGTYYAWADPDKVTEFLLQKRLRGSRHRDSGHGEFAVDYLRDKKTLPCYQPRIAFRDVSRATDTRTVRLALIPAKVFISLSSLAAG